MKVIYSILILITISGVIFIACDNDHGLYPQTYKIKGKVVLLRGQPPENTDRIEVFAIKEFPPKDPQNFLYLGRSGKLDFTKGNEIDYEIQVSPTSYDAIVLIWKEKGYDTIPDEADHQLEAKKQVPSWRRVCKALLRNDYWCKGLSFSMHKSGAYERYQKVMTKRRNQWGIFPS